MHYFSNMLAHSQISSNWQIQTKHGLWLIILVKDENIK